MVDTLTTLAWISTPMDSPEINNAITEALVAVAKFEAVQTVYLVACGGSLAQMHLPKYFVDREAKVIDAEVCNSAELIARDPKRLGASSVVILCSSSGNTPETVAAAKFAQGKGAHVIGLTTKPQSELAQVADSVVVYVSTPIVGSADSPAGIILRLVAGLVRDREGLAKYDALVAALEQVTPIANAVQEKHAPAVLEWASASKRESVIYTLSSGSNWGVAYGFSICILQEMQWVHSQAIHSGEYFHGPFEVTDFDTSFILLVGLGPARAMDLRVRAFAEKYSQRLLVLDAAEIDMPSVATEVAEYITPLVFQPLMRSYAVRLSEERGHPLTVRRYMWKMEY